MMKPLTCQLTADTRLRHFELFFTILITAFALASCATTPSPRASMVRVATAEQVEGYQFLGTVTGSSSLSGVFQHAGYENALNELLEKAARRGATHVVLDPKSEPHYWTTSQHVRGDAYRAQ